MGSAKETSFNVRSILFVIYKRIQKKMRDKLNLEKQFTFYASYHNNRVNVAIHLLCIPILLATGLVMLQYTPELLTQPELFKSIPDGQYLKVNLAFVVTLIYAICYIVMEPFAGFIGAILVSLLSVTAAKLVGTGATIGGDDVLNIAIAIHITAWILQFIGHGLFEGRAPALIDSWDQAFLTAPLFVLMEILFFLGYRKEFYAKIMKEVETNIATFQESKNK